MSNSIKSQLLVSLDKTEVYTSEVTVLHIFNESLPADTKSKLYMNPGDYLDEHILLKFKSKDIEASLASDNDMTGDSRFTWLEHVYDLGIQNELIRWTSNNYRFNPHQVGNNKSLYDSISKYKDLKSELYAELSVLKPTVLSSSDELKEEREDQYLLVCDVFNNTVRLTENNYNIHTLLELLNPKSECYFKDLVRQLPEPFIEQLKIIILNNNIGTGYLPYDEQLITFIQTLTATMALEWPAYTTNQKINALTFITQNINLENFEYKIEFLSKMACSEFKTCINHIKKAMRLGCELEPELCVAAVMSTIDIPDINTTVEF